jgi:trehalose/maltose hydrolase-like predicted phosphorylase
MYKIIPWSADLDLADFYLTAEKKGFENNASKKMLVDCFNNEREKQVWVLYYNNTAVGSVAAHSFDDVMGPNSYRIAVRTCVFTDMLPTSALRTRNQIVTHQHVTSQFLIPACIEWAPRDSKLYITSNENSAGTQRLVHRIFGPAMEETGQMKRIKDVFYRGTNQTVWQLFPEEFYNSLNEYKRW